MKTIDTPFGPLTVYVQPLKPLPLYRHILTLGENEWVIDTDKGNRLSLFDFIAMKFFKGIYLDFAAWIAEIGEPGVLPAIYIYHPDKDITIVVDPMNEGNVELTFLIGDLLYFVSVTPHTPVGLLGKIAMGVRK